MTLASPGWLVLLLLLPALLLWRRRGREGVLVPGAGEMVMQRGRRGIASAIPGALRLLVLALIILALARPRTSGGVVETRSEGVPIVIALDVSSSMLARDQGCGTPPCPPGEEGPTRLETARSTIEQFITARPEDPVGLVAFAAEAITLVPVTTHQPLLRAGLASARVGLVEDGTAIGEGLATAVNRLRRVPAEDRVIILMSDGESNRGAIDPLVAASAAAEFGIRVHTIGVGSAGDAPAARQAAAAEGLGQMEAPASTDEPLMREIARATGGEYHHAADRTALARVYDRLDRLERTPVEARRVVRYREWYLWLLAAAAGALALEWAVRASRWGAVP